MTLHPQFIVDSKGKRKRVVLSLSEYRKLLETAQDLVDHKLIDEVRDEETVPWEQVKAQLHR